MSDQTITSQSKVSVIPWGVIDGPDERKWGLKVDNAYVASNGAPLFFDTREEAFAEAKKLRKRIRDRAQSEARV